MAHELLIDDTGKACMMYVEKPPWHELGIKLASPPTAEEAIKKARMNWDVSKTPIYFGESDGPKNSIQDYYAVTPTKGWIKKERPVFGIVTSRYEILQNKEAFAFFDPLVSQGYATYETAGALGEGERIWVLAKIKGQIVVGDDDPIDKYLLLANSHDGKSSVQIKITPIRVVCQNTLTMALNQGRSIQIAHMQDMHKRLEQAKQLQAWIVQGYDMIEHTFKEMTNMALDDTKLNRYLNTVFPCPPEPEDQDRWPDYERACLRITRERQCCKNLYETDATHHTGKRNVPGSLWSGYNSVTEYVDHGCTVSTLGQNVDARLNSMWFGKGYSIKVRAYEVAMDLMRNWQN